jgi:LGFP repeat/Divergent InlB B-repeat domain
MLVAAKVEQNMHKRLAVATMLIAINACSDAQPEDFGTLDELAAEAPPGKIALEAIAQPPGGGTATVSVQALGSTVCDAAVCIVDPFSTPTFTATPAAGFKFVSWTGCAFPSTNAVNAFPATVSSETCTANFEQAMTATPPDAPVTSPTEALPATPPPFNFYTAQTAIEAKAMRVSAEIGFPVSEVVPFIDWAEGTDYTPDDLVTVCAARQFDTGAVFFCDGFTEATYLKGAIYREWFHWNSAAFEKGCPYTTATGYCNHGREIVPRTDEQVTPDGRGRYQFFGGSLPQNSDNDEAIYWTAETGAHLVPRSVIRYWGPTGYERGTWGYPTGNFTTSGADGRCPGGSLAVGEVQDFEHGFWCQGSVHGEDVTIRAFFSN